MKTNLKRFLAAVLSALTVTALLAGCGGGEEAAVSTNDLDFGGETITFAYPSEFSMAYTEGTNDPYLIHQRQRMDELEQRFNCKIAQVEGKGQYWTQMTASIAAGTPLGHVMVTKEGYLLDWFKAGAIANLADAMAQTGIDFTDSRYSQTVRKMTRFDGGQYAFSDLPSSPTGALWYANLSLFEREQLGNIYELIENKEWTWDKCEKIAAKATKTDASGNTTQWGIRASQGTQLLLSLAVSNGGSIAGFDAEGKPTLPLSEPAATEAFRKFYDWGIVKKIADIGDGSTSWDPAPLAFTEGNIAMLVSDNALFQTAQDHAMADQIGVIYPPIGPQMDDYATSASCGQMYFIPVTYQDMAPKLLPLVNELFAPDEELMEKEVVYKYPRLNDSADSLRVYLDILTNSQRHFSDATQLLKVDWVSPTVHEMCAKVLSGEQTPDEAIAANTPQFLATMSDTMEDHTLKMNEP